MKKYWHIQSNTGKTELIKQGFSWTAICSGLFGFFPIGTIIWMLVRKLWLRALAWFGLMMLFGMPMSLMDQMSQSSADTSGELAIITLVLAIPFLLLSIIPGFLGNKWTMLNRLKKGYIDRGEVEAPNEIEAIRSVQRQTGSGVQLKS